MIEIGLPQLIGFLFTMVGVMWGFAKLLFAQYDSSLSERFASRDNLLTERLKPIEEMLKGMSESERRQMEAIHQLELKIAKDYQSKEEALRFETIHGARFEGLCVKIDKVADALRSRQ